MTIGLTGATTKLGLTIIDELSSSYYIKETSLRSGIAKVVSDIEHCNVFINLAYNSTDQSKVFSNLFELWKDKPKTIINICSSGVYSPSPVLSEYLADKSHLYYLSKSLCSSYPNKECRVINLNPSTLEGNKGFPLLNTIPLQRIASLVRTVIELPQELEITEMLIKSTRLERKSSI